MNFKKKFMTILLCGILSCSMTIPVAAVSYENTTLVKADTIISNSAALSTKKSSAKEKSDTSSEEVTWPKAPKASQLSCESAVVIDAATGMVLFEQKAHKEQYPASITKIMTTLIALENSSLGETVTFSQNAIFGIEYGSSNVAVDVGEKLTMEQCLYAIMLESANEVCLGVAEHIAGDVPSYVDMMNEKVKELGLENTHFANPNGLHDDNHYTSAYDIAMISREALKNDTFRKITGTKTYVLPPTNKQKLQRYWTNHHDMLSGRRYPRYMTEDCFGGKTGYTSMAKNTLVTFEKRNNMELICVVMRANSVKGYPDYNQYTDTQLLLDYAFENYTSYDMNVEDTAESEDTGLFTKFNPVFDLKTSPIHLGEDGKVVLPNGAKLKDAEQSITYHTDITLQNGENNIGEVTYTYGNKIVGSTNIYYTLSDDIPALTQGKPIETVKSKTIRSETQRTMIRIIAIIISIVILISAITGIILLQKRRKEEYNAFKGQTHFGWRKRRKGR